jgi:ribonuclease HI
MTELLLFTDGSVNAQSSVGYGAYLEVIDRTLSLDVYRTKVKTRRFEPTSSTKLELQTLLWALNKVSEKEHKVFVHTDSQNIMGLLKRRERLEKNGYRSKGGRRLHNDELYQEFYRAVDQMDCEFVKVKGHQSSKCKESVDEFFTLVDRASRQALRNAL